MWKYDVIDETGSTERSALSSEEDQATATSNMYRKYGRVACKIRERTDILTAILYTPSGGRVTSMSPSSGWACIHKSSRSMCGVVVLTNQGCQSIRHTTNSSHHKLVTRSTRHTVKRSTRHTVNSSHGQLDTRSTRHTVNSSHGQLVTGSTRHTTKFRKKIRKSYLIKAIF